MPHGMQRGGGVHMQRARIRLGNMLASTELVVGQLVYTRLKHMAIVYTPRTELGSALVQVHHERQSMHMLWF